MKNLFLIILIIPLLTSCGKQTESDKVESIVKEYFEAVKTSNHEKAKSLMTKEMVVVYETSIKALDAAKAMGMDMSALTDTSLKSVKVESITKDNASVETTVKYKGKVDKSTLSLKKVNGKWKISSQ